MPIRVQTVQSGLERSIRNAVKKVNRTGGLSVNINEKQFTRPLGKITGSVSEFNKSLEASNARVLAFGASVGIIQAVQKSFAALIRETIQVEKRMADINVVMGVTNKQLAAFGDGLFKVAKNTAQSFNTVAIAATELARQGLSMEETLKRTNDALILTRLTGLDAANAVSGLTAALNTFNKAGLDSTKILSKMAAVDVQFAVSTEDLIDAVSRAGAVAQDAGVSFDELLGAVTAAQQMTARGGKVIGNSFKTIFTRIQRSSTIKRLEELGIAVRDVRGNTLPAIRVLENLSKTYEHLADTTKAAVAEQVGGVFQINILKAAIKDLGEQNSILARATKISNQATDEAIKKNELLNQTLSALTSQAATGIQEFAATVGNLAFEDNLRNYLASFQSVINFVNDGLKNGEGFGSDTARGFIKGFGNVIAGPGMVLAIGILGKLLFKTFSFLGGSVKELLGIVSTTKNQRDIQKSIVGVLAENSALQKKILSQEGNRAAQERTILTILQAQSKEQTRIAASASAIAPAISRAGYNAQLRRRSSGHIPNYASSVEKSFEKSGARAGGYSPGAVKSMDMPGQGRVVYNTAENVKNFPGMVQPAIMPPKTSKAGKNYKKAFGKTHGFNPYASRGFVPNFARNRLSYNSESPVNIARALIHGKSTAMNLKMGGGKKFADSWHSYGPAMATGTEMNSIREKIYKKLIQNKGSDFRGEINKSLKNFGGNVPKEWGAGRNQDDLIYGMVEQLNSARKSSRKLELPYSKGFVPNFGMRLNANKIKSIGQGKIHSDKFDDTIGMGALDKIITNGLFKSIKYQPKSGSAQDLTFTGARHGVHAHKKGASAPKGFSSWADFDKNSPLGKSRVVHASSAGQGAGGYRRLHLDRIQSVVSQGKHLKVDPNMANSGFVPNYSAFHHDKNLPFSAPKAGERVTHLKALEFMTEPKLLQAMKMFSKEGPLDFKGSYPGMSIKDFQKNFPQGSSNMLGLGHFSDKRQGEILQNPAVMKSFYKYLTGKSTSIGIEAALTGDEKKHFMSKYGMIPRMKSIEDGIHSGQKKKDRLSLIREDFLMAGSSNGEKSGSVRGYIEKAFKQSRSSKNFNQLLAQNQAMAPPRTLGLPFDPNRGVQKARSIGGILAQMYKPTSSSFTGGGGLQGPGSFGALSGRFRGDKAITRRAVDSGVLNQIVNTNNTAARNTSSGERMRDLIPGMKNKGDMAAIERLMEKEGMTSVQAFRSLGLHKDPAYKLDGFLGGSKFKTRGARGNNNLKNLPDLRSLIYSRRFRGMGGKNPFDASGHIPNYASARIPAKYKTQVRDDGPRNDIDGPPKQVFFQSSVGGKNFATSHAIDIADFKDPNKRALQVIMTSDANPSLRGKGYGKDLYEHMAQYSKKNGYTGLYGDMGTSISAMRVVDSIAKGKKFKVEKAEDLQFHKDIGEKNGMWAGENYTYKISNQGHVPNYAMFRPESMAMNTRSKMSPRQNLEAAKLKKFIVKRGQMDSAAKPYESPNMPQLFDVNTVRNNKKWQKDPLTSVKFGGSYRAGVTTEGGQTFLGRYHEDIYKILKEKKINTKGSVEHELTWASPGFSSPQSERVPGGRATKGWFSEGHVPNYGFGSFAKRMGSKAWDNRNNLAPYVLGKEALMMGKEGLTGALGLGKDIAMGVGKGAYRLGRGAVKGVYGAGKGIVKGLNDTLLDDPRGWLGTMGGIGAAYSMLPPAAATLLLPGILGAGAVRAGGRMSAEQEQKRIMQQKALELISLKNKGAQSTSIGKLRVSELTKELKEYALKDSNKNFNEGSYITKSMRKDLGLSQGFVPNFNLFSPGAKNVLSTNPQYSAAVSSAVSRESSFGLTPKVVSAPSLKSSTNPGLAVVNKEQEGGRLSNARKLHGGLNPKQGASGGFVPNYAPIDAMKLLSIMSGSSRNVESLGLRSLQNARDSGSSKIDLGGAPAQLQAALKTIQDAFAQTSKNASEAATRTKILNGTINSLGDKKTGRQILRSDAATRLAGSNDPRSSLVSGLMKDGRLSETRLSEQRNIAMQTLKSNPKDKGAKRTLQQLNSLNSHLDSQARAGMNNPASIGKELGNNMMKQLSNANNLEKFTKGTSYDKSSMQKAYAKDFLATRGVPTDGMSNKEAGRIFSGMMATGGKEAAKQFSSFAKDQGVKSSVGSLAKGGLAKGDLRGLTTGVDSKTGAKINNSATKFVTAMNALERRVASGASAKDIKKAERVAQKEAANATKGLGSTNTQALTNSVSQLTQEQKRLNASAKADAKQKSLENKQNRAQAKGGSLGRLQSGFYGGRQGNVAGSGRLGRLGNLAGRFGTGAAGSVKNFASSMKGFGGMTGMAASFALPMLGGMIAPTKSRPDRASFDEGTGSYRITEGAARERGGSTLMGAGIGALFGLPGMLIGAAVGFASSASKMTLSIQEIIQLREKEISVLSQNINAISKLADLTEGRAKAFGSGNREGVDAADAAINAALSGITDQGVLTDVMAARGSRGALSSVNKKLQNRLSQDVSTQGVATAIGKNSGQGAAVNIANLIDQRLRSGEIAGGRETVNKTLNDIKVNLQKSQSAGTAISKERLLELRRNAAGRNSLASEGTMGGAAFGAIVAGVGLSIASILATPISGGGSLLGLKAGAMLIGGAAVGGGMAGREIETGKAQAQLENLSESNVAAANQLAMLKDAGIITQGQFESLSASFNAGKMTFDELIGYLEDNLDKFQKLGDAQDVLGQRTFNLSSEFKKTIVSLKVASELEKIREGGRLKRESSIVQFATKFQSGTPEDRLKDSRRRMGVFEQGVALKSSAFNNDSEVQFLEQTKQAAKTLSFGPLITQGLLDTTRKQGLSGLENEITDRKLTGNVDLFQGLDKPAREKMLNNLDEIFNKQRDPANQGQNQRDIRSAVATELQLPSVTDEGVGKLKAMLGGGRRDQIMQGTDLGNFEFVKEITKEDQTVLQDIVDQQRKRGTIIAEQIIADRKAQKLQEAQLIVQGRVNDVIAKRVSANAVLSQLENNSVKRSAAKAENRISGLNFEATDTFRGSRSNRGERTRQEGIQEKIFNEELKIKTKEEVSRLKSEAIRLVSEQKLTFALNNLSEEVEKSVRSISGDKTPLSGIGPAVKIALGAAASSSMPNPADFPGGNIPLATVPTSVSKVDEKSIEKYNDKIRKLTERRIEKEKDLETKKLEAMESERSRILGATGPNDRASGAHYVKTQNSIIDEISKNPHLSTERKRELTVRAARGGPNAQQLKDPNNINSKLIPGLMGAGFGQEGFQGDNQDFKIKRIHGYESLVSVFNDTMMETKGATSSNSPEVKSTQDELQKINDEIDGMSTKIQDIRKKTIETVTTGPASVKRIQDLSNISIETTNDVVNAINKIGLSARGIDILKSKIHDLRSKEGMTEENINALDKLSEVITGSGEALEAFANSQRLQLFQQKFANFGKSLQFMDESMGTFRGMTTMDESNVRQRAAGSTLNRAFEQDTRQRNFEILSQDPTATSADVANAKVAARSQTIGTGDQRKRLSKMIEAMNNANDKVAQIGQRTDITEGKRAELVGGQEAILIELNESMVDLAMQMKRTTPRDQGVFSEIRQNMGVGLEAGFANLETDSEQIYTKLGEQLPYAFRNGMVDAMQAALNGADNLRDKLKGIGISFLQMIQKAFLQSAASRVTGALGGLFDFKNSGGMITGGSGVRDDVPAMLTGGEYVIKKSAVSKYGMGFMDKVNSGQVSGFAKGGAVSMNVGAPKAAKRESFEDKNEYGTVTRYKTLEKEVGINPRLTGFARANDRKILKYFQEQEGQFREDLNTSKQVKARAENKTRVRKAQQNAMIGVVAGIAGGVLISKTADWYKGTDFAKKRADKRAAKQFNKQFNKTGGSYTNRSGRTGYEITGKERRLLRQDVDNFKGQGATASQMRDFLSSQDVQFKMNRMGGGSDYDVTLNRGGRVPAMVTGGEYIMNPKAVKQHGSAMMSSINSGTYSGGGSGSGSNISHGDVNISINVDNNSTSQGGENQLNTKEFSSKVKAAVIQVINQEKRVGGSLR